MHGKYIPRYRFNILFSIVNIAEHSFIEALRTENNTILGLKCSLRGCIQIPNLFVAPLPTAVCSR
jgi:hypothetical protein